ncbi:hypothetical protein BTVI_24146 [Pitangus sulphuratus]|nr:hypothetical protein BTVI_24146 [Pitangus sulphuratus]
MLEPENPKSWNRSPSLISSLEEQGLGKTRPIFLPGEDSKVILVPKSLEKIKLFVKGIQVAPVDSVIVLLPVKIHMAMGFTCVATEDMNRDTKVLWSEEPPGDLIRVLRPQAGAQLKAQLKVDKANPL